MISALVGVAALETAIASYLPISTSLVVLLVCSLGANPVSAKNAYGIVFEDRNENGVRDSGERGLPAIAVSNQRDVVLTDADGKWSLPYGEDTVFLLLNLLVGLHRWTIMTCPNFIIFIRIIILIVKIAFL